MKRSVITILTGLTLTILSTAPALALNQVANYSTGTPGAENYEHFSFWIKDNQVREIEYAYGKAGRLKPLTLKYLGHATLNGVRGFQVRFPNALVLTVLPQGQQLKVVDNKGKYAKTFNWEYEGPIDGKGTFCQPCTQDETTSMQLLSNYYFK